MTAPDPAKGPAAVVLLQRHGLVLALTRKARVFDLHLPGGKAEAKDRGDLRVTAARELAEEIGLYLWGDQMIPLVSFMAHTGRPVQAYTVEANPHWPDTFRITDAGWPGWVPPASLVAPWCTFRDECRQILEAAGIPT